MVSACLVPWLWAWASTKSWLIPSRCWNEKWKHNQRIFTSVFWTVVLSGSIMGFGQHDSSWKYIRGWKIPFCGQEVSTPCLWPESTACQCQECPAWSLQVLHKDMTPAHVDQVSWAPWKRHGNNTEPRESVLSCYDQLHSQLSTPITSCLSPPYAASHLPSYPSHRQDPQENCHLEGGT